MNKFVFSLLLVFSSYAVADCKLTVTRIACSGKEDVSYKKCNGIKTCDEYTEAKSAAVCKQDAIMACSNSRTSITKSKIITAMYDDKPLYNSVNGLDFCVDYKEKDTEFNKCD